jgi:hypothetical protein
MTRLAKLPIGIQSFEVIRQSGYVYVDKTEHVYRLVDEGMFYFLARPRRFGKSLLVSTLRCLFEGKKDLFEGLWLAAHTDWSWDEHPIILLDFNQIAHGTPENLRVGLDDALIRIAQVHGITLEQRLLQGRFTELILELYQKTGRPVVVLVDEYDKPLIDHLGRGKAALQIARANRDILKGFFGVLKGGDVAPVLRFVFITGVSRFSRVSLFSELNNLDDITLSDGYAGLLGYTQSELEHYFQAHIERFAEAWQVSYEDIVARLQEHYDGYRFSHNPLQVYNPFSTLKAFRELKFGNYWFETGTPTFLINLLKEADYPLPQIETLCAPESIFGSYEIDDLQPEALLFQTGYVTIRQIEGRLYHFGYPNQEVKTAFSEMLLYSLAESNKRRIGSQVAQLAGYLQQEDFKAFFETIQAIFGSIPYTLGAKRDEAYFHTLFYLMVSASGVEVQTEILTSRGRIDLLVEFPDKVFVMEFKCTQKPQAALQQIRDQGYAERYQKSGKRIFLMGLEFSTEQRNLVAWQVQAPE